MDEGSLQTITALRVAIREHTSGDVTNKLMMIVKALGIAIVTYQKKLETKLIEMETEIAKHRSDLKKSEDKTFLSQHVQKRQKEKLEAHKGHIAEIQEIHGEHSRLQAKFDQLPKHGLFVARMPAASQHASLIDTIKRSEILSADIARHEALMLKN